MRMATAVLIGLVIGSGLVSCGTPTRDRAREPVARPRPGETYVVARSEGRQWTGVAVTRRGRVFVSYPRWEGPIDNSVEEVLPDGTRVAFPDEEWNSWRPGDDPASKFVCVQAVYVDAKDRLWVVDPASPQMAGVVSGGAKLVEISPATRRVLRVIRFDERIAPPGSYLNDVRVDTEREFAYITDSGTGGIVVVDLTTNQAWRRLDTSPSTKADPAVILSVGGRRLVLGGEEGNGEFLRVHVDGLALSPDGEWLYYQALTGRTLYRVPAALLRDPEVSDLRVDGAVENLGLTVATDGMAMDAAGNLYFTAIERDAIVYRTPQGRMGILAQDERLRWPDSLAISDGGEGPWLYVSTSQIHLTPWFRVDGQMPETPYYVLKMGLLRE